jgi:hypothetical protein
VGFFIKFDTKELICEAVHSQAVQQLHDIRQHAIVRKQEDSGFLCHLSSQKLLSFFRVIAPHRRCRPHR